MGEEVFVLEETDDDNDGRDSEEGILFPTIFPPSRVSLAEAALLLLFGLSLSSMILY